MAWGKWAMLCMALLQHRREVDTRTSSRDWYAAFGLLAAGRLLTSDQLNKGALHPTYTLEYFTF
eukprot:scaffold660244_cov59-Prasinocladus_malaysianus.AAC.1